MRILIALPGLHKYERGAETALLALARELSHSGNTVTVMGSGPSRAGTPYRFVHIPALSRERFERFPGLPVLRSETVYEEASWVLPLMSRYSPSNFDVTLTCSYPFTNWVLRRPALAGRPPHVFVTQNGDWPSISGQSEYRAFGCEGLVCTNPDYYERNELRWPCAMIPNGVDLGRFSPGAGDRGRWGIPSGAVVVLMVSALITTKRVADGIDAVAEIPNAHLLVAGDGPLRDEIDARAHERLPGRFTRMSVTADQMPLVYRTADVFLHLSREESFGNVYIEAMACGLPIVAHDSARLRWIVGDGEFLADTDAAGQTIAALLAASMLGKEGRDARLDGVKRFAWPSVASQYERFLSATIAREAGRSPM